MSTVVRQSTGVEVNVTTRSVVYVANTLFQMVLRIIAGRGLPPTYITYNRDIIGDGFFVWLTERSLRTVYLEVAMPGGAQALERWDFTLGYGENEEDVPRNPPIDEVANLCARLAALPQGAEYRILVHTAPWATPVPGWVPSQLLPLNLSGSEQLRAWGYGGIAASVTYRGGGEGQRRTSS
ncbi:MAG: hypothetical protein FJ291_00085 [Planctomycetes bacterium]|nr:hypothetical protein [Planctomycetota bacterium]